MRHDALQLLSVHLSVFADYMGRIFFAGQVQQLVAGRMARAGVAGVLLRQQLAVRCTPVGLDRLQLCDRISVDPGKAELGRAFCGAERRRGRRPACARLFQICRLPCRQSECIGLDPTDREHSASGRDFLLHLHPNRVFGRRPSRRGRALSIALLPCSSPIFRI